MRGSARIAPGLFFGVEGPAELYAADERESCQLRKSPGGDDAGCDGACSRVDLEPRMLHFVSDRTRRARHAHKHFEALLRVPACQGFARGDVGLLMDFVHKRKDNTQGTVMLQADPLLSAIVRQPEANKCTSKCQVPLPMDDRSNVCVRPGVRDARLPILLPASTLPALTS